MKAIVYHRSGSRDVLQCAETEKPVPGNDEVLIKVRAASVNPADDHLLRHRFLRRILSALTKQKTTRPGRDVAGQVEAIGRNATKFKPGDPVFGLCGGAFAEYACASESALAMKPAYVSFEQAASVPLAGLTALQALRDTGKIQPGQRVVINGAAGGVGTFAVQIAKCFGADVTAVCSTRNVDMVRAIGADRVMDYTQENFTKGRQRYDLMVDLVGNHPLSACRRVLNPKGICVLAGVLAVPKIGALLPRTLEAVVLSRFRNQKFLTFMAKLNQEDLNLLREFMEGGKLTPVIDRVYTLNDTPEAVSYLAERHARGKVVITTMVGGNAL